MGVAPPLSKNKVMIRLSIVRASAGETPEPGLTAKAGKLAPASESRSASPAPRLAHKARIPTLFGAALGASTRQ